MAETAPEIDPVYVYKFNGDRYRELEAWWTFYDGRQHDHCTADWAGRGRKKEETYLQYRQREKGPPPRQNRVNHDDRRPNVPMGLVQRGVDRFTETTCGKQASIGVRGDESSTLAFGALAEVSDFWDAITETETIGGACGSSAVVPEIIDGIPSHVVYLPHKLYVRKWADKARWIPEEVIYQTQIDVEVLDEATRQVVTKTFVRTKMWTSEHTIAFKDVDLSTYNPDDELVPEEGGVLAHGWGRCPVVWHQNVRNTSSPDGQPDARNTANLEISDNVDKLASHAVKATRANTEPTVVRSDRDMMFMIHPTISKGVGNEIRTSESGKVGYLETNGDSVKMAWDSVDRLTLTFLRNTNCVIYDVDLAMAARGTGDSGEALQQRAQSMQKRCNRKRVTLQRTISQLVKMWLDKMREVGITSEDEDGDGIILPPRCYTSEPEGPVEDEDADPDARSQAAAQALMGAKMNPEAVHTWRDMAQVEERYAPHEMGGGSSLDIRWPPYQELTPSQVQSYVQSLQTATGNKAVLSQQTGIELAAVALGLPDGMAEKRRMLEEKAEGLERIQGLVGGGDPGDEAEDEAAAAADTANTGAAAEDNEADPETQDRAGDGKDPSGGGTTKPT